MKAGDPITPEGKPLMESPSSPDSAAYKGGDVKFAFQPPSEAQSATEPDVMCGAGNWRPNWLQKCADIRVFTLVLSVMSLLNGVVFSYFNAVITSIENRFGLSSSMMGFLKNVDNVGYLLAIVLVSHFGRYANKPRLFAAACVLSSFATLLFAFPHFIYGPGDEDDDSVNGTSKWDSRSITHFCDPSGVLAPDDKCKKKLSGLLGKFNTGALAFFIASEILQGVSNAPATSLGVTYMDDNTKAGDSPKYFGWMFAMRALAPLVGYGLGAWTTSMYVDLSDTDIDPRSPRWVGAWWVGFIIIAIIMLGWTLPVLLFPPRLPGQSKENFQDTNMKELAKDLPKAFLRLAKNPLYICLVVGMSCDVYMTGFYTFLPKYIEKHFKKTPAVASIVAGLISAFGWSLGPIIGGRFLGRLCKKPEGAMRCVVVISLVTCLAFLGLRFLGCSKRDYAGVMTHKKFEPIIPCNSNCTCNEDIFEPVCGPGGKNYANACFAGCPEPLTKSSNGTQEKTLLHDCSCAMNETGGSEVVESGFCVEECRGFIAYAVILFLASLINGMYIIPVITTGMRCVDHKDKALSLAVSTGVMQVVGFPAPLFYGFAIDRTCMVRDTRCGAEGRCLDYNSSMFRTRLHGFTMIVKGAATLVYLLGWYFSRRYDYEEQKNEEAPDSPMEGPESQEKSLANAAKNKA